MRFAQQTLLFIASTSLYVLSIAEDCPFYGYQIISDSANNATSLTTVVSEFRALLGGESNGNAPGPLNGGQRSINWDAPIVPFEMPFDFFNARVPRGALFNTSGNQFRVSNPSVATAEPVPSPEEDEPVLADDRFDSILPTQISAQFKTFSPERLFTPLWSNTLTASFKIPGSSTDATVTGFGAVFTDVDRVYTTTMNYFDKGGCLIATVNVPVQNEGLSFAGLVVYDDTMTSKVAAIDRVVISLGDAAVSNFGDAWGEEGQLGRDVVVMDDLIYGEPVVA